MSLPTIQRVDHIQINVPDLESASRFYRDLLGLKEIARPESFTFAGAWFRMGDMDLHLVVRGAEPASARHFCLYVTDVHGAAGHFEQAGFAVQWDVKYKIPRIDRFFVHDPAGNRIEIQGADTVETG